MQIFEIVKVNDPEDGHEIKLYLTQEETQTLLQYALNYLVTIGAVNFVTQKDGVDIKDLDMEDQGKPN